MKQQYPLVSPHCRGSHGKIVANNAIGGAYHVFYTCSSLYMMQNPVCEKITDICCVNLTVLFLYLLLTLVY